MKLNALRNNPGAHKRRTRVGRGSSSGLGKTSGRGVKGAKARAGVAIHGFEGGQMPLYMRIPKRGFNNLFGTDFAVVNLSRIQAAVDAGKLDPAETVTDALLRRAGLAKRARDGVRILGTGALTAKLNFEVAGASAPAVAAIEKAGGSIKTTFAKKVHLNKKGGPGKRQQRRAKAKEKRAGEKSAG